MQALKCLKTRRSARVFKDTAIAQEIIDEIIDCARKAPSANNSQPWAFIVVKDQEQRQALSKVQPWASFVAKAPVCIALCMTSAGADSSPSNYLSVACAGENILLAAHAQGLAGCWAYVKDFNDPEPEKKTREILAVPDAVEIIALIPIGYAKHEPKSKSLKEKEQLVHQEQW